MSDSWFSVGYKAIQEEMNKEATRGAFSPEFRMDDETEARIRFLTEEPYTFRQHSLTDGSKCPKYTCRQGPNSSCPLCDAGHKPRFVGVYVVYDYGDRFSIDRSTGEEKRVNKKVEPGVKLYVQGIRVLKVLDRLHKREGGLISQDHDILRTGKKMETTYTFLPKAPTDTPSEAKGTDGKVKMIDIPKSFAVKTEEELKAVANRLLRGNQSVSKQQQSEDEGGAFTSGVSF